MRTIILFLLMLPLKLLAMDVEAVAEIQILKLFEQQIIADIATLPDLVDKDQKTTRCVDEYIRRQSKSYAKLVQNNLYDLIHNFDRVTSKIYGKKQQADDMSYEDKIGALAIVQCEAYYTLGVLK